MDKQRFLQEAGNLELVIADRVKDSKIVPAILIIAVCRLAHLGLSLVYNPIKLTNDSTMLLNVGVLSLIITLAAAYITWALSFGYRMAPMSQLKVGKRMHALAVITLLLALFSFALSAYMAVNFEDFTAFQQNPQAILTNKSAMIFGALSFVGSIVSLVMIIYSIMILVDMVRFKLPLYKPLLMVLIVGVVVVISAGAVTAGAAIANPNVENNPVVIMAAQGSSVIMTLLSLYLLFSIYRVVTAKK